MIQLFDDLHNIVNSSFWSADWIFEWLQGQAAAIKR